MKRNANKLFASVLAASMVISSTAMAEPLDELNAVLENQEALMEEVLLSKTLGLTELMEAFDEEGMQVQIQLGMTDQTAQSLGIEDIVPEDGYLNLNLQIDQNLQKWLFEAGIGAGEEALLDLGLYGDMEMLALSVPQFFAGAVALGSGSFLEQYNGSGLQEAVGEETVIPDFDMKFFPEDSDDELSEFEALLEQQAFDLEAAMLVEKAEEEDQIRYTAHYATEDLMKFYEIIFDEYMAAFESTGLVSSYEMEDTQQEIDVMLQQMASVMGEELAINFYVQDDLLTKIDYEIYIDTAELEEELAAMETEAEAAEDAEAVYETEAAEDAEAVYETEAAEDVEIVYETEDASEDESLVSIDTNVEVNSFKGNIKYEFVFTDPQQPMQGFDLNLQVEEEESGEMIMVQIGKQTSFTETTSRTTVDMTVWENGESLYSDTLFSSYYDAETGDFDADLTLGDETGEDIVLHLDSVISPMDKGFVWTIDALELQAAGESAGLCAEISVSSDPGPIETPQDIRMLLALDQGGLMGLLTEISVNLDSWAAKFAPEEETEYYDTEEIYYEDETAAEDMTEEAVTDEDSVSVGIIGSADGPTSVFVAGSVG